MRMIDDVSDIAAMYDGDVDKEDERLERHQLEHEVTWRYLDEFLPKSGSILEIGAATGRYTLELAKRGYEITAVDLSERLLEKNEQRLKEAGLCSRVSLLPGDARNLNKVKENSFDTVLMMGPLYHLVIEKDRKLALSEAYSKLKNGGVIVSSLISRYGILGDLLKNMPAWIENTEEVRSVMENGRDPERHPRLGFRGYFVKASEIAPLHESVGFETLAVAGAEPGISADDASYNKLDERKRKLWLDLFFEVSAETSTIGASRHLLYVGRKVG